MRTIGISKVMLLSVCVFAGSIVFCTDASAYINSSSTAMGEFVSGPLSYSSADFATSAVSAGSSVDGVLTTVTVRASGAATTGRVFAVRPTFDGVGNVTMRLVGSPVPIAVPASDDPNGTATEIATQIPLKAGDALALQMTGDAAGETRALGTSYAAKCAGISPVIFTGGEIFAATHSCDSQTPAVWGMVSSDYDGDGVSDSSDVCILDPARSAPPCDSFEMSIIKAPPKKVVKGKTFRLVLRLTNNGPPTESIGGLLAQIKRGSDKKLKFIDSPKGCPTGRLPGPMAACNFKGFRSGESHDLLFTLRAVGTGRATIQAIFNRVDPYFNAYRPGRESDMRTTLVKPPKPKHRHKH